ncbi:hypothetical protein N0V93_005490 [Gnomoniopsis smithogilvyi]|uniref:Heterokaryon incompatibility domain-containing protein n=1 Tax=Gnomoniopsis smithogilvyi TaxID=1191159 RepID=A0A9W8YVN8_9PEZI|nr:hypothetical protein N0V93_005490 [Gnomoniopsis smithogilvyi]
MSDPKDEWYIGSVDRLWPRRLLDTVSLVSHERRDGNIYNDEKEPNYSIISYTWGRFALPDASKEAARLPIGGIKWKIPAIDPRFFTQDKFRQVINKTREMSGNRFLWLDIACIDQEDYKTKMEEVGRQAGIFANAGMAFTWLWTASTEKLRVTLEDVFESRQISKPIDSAMPDSKVGNWLNHLQQAVDTVLNDCWFSSLWTLQEQGLRPDAVILSRDAEPVRMGYPLPNTKFHWIASIDRLYLVQSVLEQGVFGNEQLKTTANEIRDRICKAGYAKKMSFSGNPNTMFTLAYQRQATNQLDRIYGIMALYNIQVGAAANGADVARQYSLSELEDEFTRALNSKSSFLGQSFLHIEKPSPGRSWKITQHARVPDICRWPRSNAISLDDCLLEAHPSGTMKITASTTSFSSLIGFWKARVLQFSDEEFGADQLLVAVDDYVCREHSPIPLFDYEEGEPTEKTFNRTKKTVFGILETFDSNRLSVMRLGGFEWNPWSMMNMFGLLVLHDAQDRYQCQRLGICRWEGDIFDIPESVEALRPSFEHRYTGVLH